MALVVVENDVFTAKINSWKNDKLMAKQKTKIYGKFYWQSWGFDEGLMQKKTRNIIFPFLPMLTYNIDIFRDSNLPLLILTLFNFPMVNLL